MRSTEYYRKLSLVKEAILNSLYIPVYIANILDYYKKSIEMGELESKMKKAKYFMTISSGPYILSRAHYNEAKENYDTAKESYDAVNAKTQKLAEGISKQLLKKPEFIGYRVHHRYRAKNNAGDVLIGDAHFLLDNDLTQIIAQHDEVKQLRRINNEDFMK